MDFGPASAAEIFHKRWPKGSINVNRHANRQTDKLFDIEFGGYAGIAASHLPNCRPSKPEQKHKKKYRRLIESHGRKNYNKCGPLFQIRKDEKHLACKLSSTLPAWKMRPNLRIYPAGCAGGTGTVAFTWQRQDSKFMALTTECVSESSSHMWVPHCCCFYCSWNFTL